MNRLVQIVRQLRRRRVATALSIGLLALGLGLSVAFFSLLDSALLSGLPFPGGDRMVAFSTNQAAGWPMPLDDYRDIEAAQRTFQWSAPMRTFNTTVTRGDRTRGLIGGYVPFDLFSRLGVEPIHGRGFTAADADPANPAAVLISHRLWHGTYGADPAILGEEVTLNRERCVVVGVMPPGFRFPLRHDIWSVFGRPGRQWSEFPVFGFALRAPGVSLDAARSDLERVVASLDATRPLADGRTAALDSFVSTNIGDRAQGALRAMVFAALGLLGLTCANLANLRWAESLRRTGELDTRMALGARSGDLVVSLLLESLVLGVVAAALGLAFAWGLVATLGKSLLGGAYLERIFWVEASIDLRAAAFAGLCALVATCLGTLAPIVGTVVRSRRGRIGASGGSRTRTAAWSRGLVSLQIGVCFALLTGAGLWAAQAADLLSEGPGFDPDHLSSVRLSSYQAGLDDNDERLALFDRLRREVAAEPGVRDVAFASAVPWGHVPRWPVGAGSEEPARDTAPQAEVMNVSEGFFETLDLDLLVGRDLPLGQAQDVAVISRSLADRLFDGEPIGRTITLGARRSSESPRPVQVVGVVADLDLDRTDTDDRNLSVFLPSSQVGDGLFLVVRRDIGATTSREIVERVLERSAPLVATLDELTVDDALASSVWVESRLAQIFTLFAIAALIVTAIGVYAVIALMVQRRERELGIRSAIGARPRDLQALVLSESGRQLVLGLVVGVGALWLGSRLLDALLVDGLQLRTTVLATAAWVVAGASLVGCWAPTRRAAKTDPARCLSRD